MQAMHDFLHPLDQAAQASVHLSSGGFKRVNTSIDPGFDRFRSIGEPLIHESVILINGCCMFSSDPIEPSNGLAMGTEGRLHVANLGPHLVQRFIPILGSGRPGGNEWA